MCGESRDDRARRAVLYRHSLCSTQDVLAQNVPMNRMPSGVRRREVRGAEKRTLGAEKRTKGCGEEK